MSPQNDRRVPRYTEPSPHEVLAKLKQTIDDGHRQMEALEEKALSGHYADRAQASRITGRYPEEAADQPEPYYGKETLNRGIGSTTALGINKIKTPEFVPPLQRVLMAEQRVRDARGHLEAVCERLVGPIPLQDTAEAFEPNPWGGATGELCNAADRIRHDCDRIEFLLRALDELVP